MSTQPTRTLTFVLNDPPFENARSTTALRLIDRAIERGFHVNVFAYEGAVALAFAKQTQHANAVHGRDLPPKIIRCRASGSPRDPRRRKARPEARLGQLRPVRRRARRQRIDRRHASWQPRRSVKFVQSSDNTLVDPTR